MKAKASPLPGHRIRALAERWLDACHCRTLIDPAVADLQYEVREAGTGRWARVAALVRGYAACLRVLAIALLLRRSAMKKIALALAGCGLVALSMSAGAHKTATHAVFVGICAFWLGPFMLAVWLIGRRWSPDQAARLALIAVPLWFLAGAAIGWACVPDAWPGSVSLTIDAAMGAAIYGNQFEHLAERVLEYPMFVGLLGAAGATIISLATLALQARSSRQG